MQFKLPKLKWRRFAISSALALTLVILFSSSYIALPYPTEAVAASPRASAVIARFPAGFWFGLANAPAQVEEQLADSWMDFARRGKVSAFGNQTRPEDKLRFFSQAETELDLAAATGIQVFRMGIDWGRLAPLKPGSVDSTGRIIPEGIQDQAALRQYRSIIQEARQRGMRVMLTLFHHSLPKWSVAEGGWLNDATAGHFSAFAASAALELGDLVDEWVTFNEANVFLVMTYVTGNWPPGLGADYTSFIDTPQRRGNYNVAFDNLVKAHKDAWEAIHRLDRTVADTGSSAVPARVGIAHFVSQYYAYSVMDIPVVFASRNLKVAFDFPDAIRRQLDFLGINYYGEEVIKGTSVAFLPGREYSDSGRSIYPEGLFKVLDHVNTRYNQGLNLLSDAKPLPFIITENGISDEDDIFRPSYLIEHLLAVRQALNAGIPVQGYIFWTVSDNFEWADGYGPKFGLVAVDRSDNLKRHPRDSYYLFSEIVKSRDITQEMRDRAWQRVMDRVGTPRKFYRSADGSTPLDRPRQRPVSTTDWRMPAESNPATWSAVSYLHGLMEWASPWH